MATCGFNSQRTEIARLAAAATAPEKIFLLGCSITQRRTESIFVTETALCTYVSHYYLLVLVNKDAAVSCNSLQDKAENACRHVVPVTAIVLDIKQFDAWLGEGHAFACKVYKAAACIYDAGNIKLTLPGPENAAALQTARNCFTAGTGKALEFLAGADLYRIRGEYKMAAFMLHQSAEQALHSLLRAKTGLYVVTHNIDKLLRYCTMVSYKLPELFPQHNDKEQQLFKLLQNAYADARYREDYHIKNDALELLTARVRKLIDLVKDENYL